MSLSLLVVRLSALGDLVHAVPAVAALRRAWPEARIDWLADARYSGFLEFVPGIDRVLVVGAGRTERAERAGRPEWRFAGATGMMSAVRALRARRYDAAVDFQGLLKSAFWARSAGARRTVGFAADRARERAASWLYSDRIATRADVHVIDQNLDLAAALGADAASRTVTLQVPPSSTAADIQSWLGWGALRRYAILNPGAGWPNKRWSPDCFAAVAVHLREAHAMPSVVVWGPGEHELARAVASASRAAAVTSPATSLGDLLALARDASLFVAGDTGPLQLAAAVGTPIVGVFGPTNPTRNGPWSADDICLSEFERCECHHKRRCRRASPCIQDVEVTDVLGAIDRRLAREASRG